MEESEVSVPVAAPDSAARSSKEAGIEALGEGTMPRSNDSTSGSQTPSSGAMQSGGSEEGAEGNNDIPLSKSQLKKRKRQQEWEDAKDDRKRRRKEKKQNRQARKRAEKDAKIAAAKAAGLDPEEVLRADRPAKLQKHLVPVTIILDCDFEDYMRDTELVSLSSQITRSYSQNRNGQHQAHLFISSWKGKLKTRYETVLQNSHTRWKDCHFVEGDFLEAAKEAHELMKSPNGGSVVDVLRRGEQDPTNTTPVPEAESSDSNPSVVYLSSESPYTLERLEPYTSYVIGGIVDKNREKGLCYRRAQERGVRTAKLPIGDYMVMASRQVLTTNQVVEIMSKWLESGDWKLAFTETIPKRKGGKLKEAVADEVHDDGDGIVDDKDEVDDENDEADKDVPSETPRSSTPPENTEMAPPTELQAEEATIQNVG